MNVQEPRQRGYGESVLGVVEQPTSTRGRHSIWAYAGTNRGEYLRERILVPGDESQASTKRRRYIGPSPLLDRFAETITIRNDAEDHGAVPPEAIGVRHPVRPRRGGSGLRHQEIRADGSGNRQLESRHLERHR